MHLPCSSAAALPHRAGWFRFLLADQSWEWSSEAEWMYDCSIGVPPVAANQVLFHTHPDDEILVAETLRDGARSGRPFHTRHRVIDGQGGVHEVVTGGDSLRDETGVLIGTQGFYVDVTPATEREHQQSVTAAVADIAESRSVIEQAKGMLMLVYRIDAEAAFDLLKWRSMAGNVKLRALAEQLVDDFTSLSFLDVLPARSQYDELLLTAHDRVAGSR